MAYNSGAQILYPGPKSLKLLRIKFFPVFLLVNFQVTLLGENGLLELLKGDITRQPEEFPHISDGLIFEVYPHSVVNVE